MFTKSILVTLAVAIASATAFKVPLDLADGVYMINATDSEAEPVRIGDAVNSQPLASRQNSFPGSSWMQCDNVDLNHADTDKASAGLRDTCRAAPDIPGGSHILSASGSVFAYACSYGGSQPCRLSEVNEYYTWSTDECGSYEGSFLHIPDWKKAYGRAPSTIVNICP